MIYGWVPKNAHQLDLTVSGGMLPKLLTYLWRCFDVFGTSIVCLPCRIISIKAATGSHFLLSVLPRLTPPVMRVLVACVLALTSSALGYLITVPNMSDGWTGMRPQPWVLHSANFPQKC